MSSDYLPMNSVDAHLSLSVMTKAPCYLLSLDADKLTPKTPPNIAINKNPP